MEKEDRRFKKVRYTNNRRNNVKSVPGKNTRRPTLIEDVILNGALINCRSIKPKLKFLATCFKINNLSFALLNETWLYKNDPQAKKLLSEMNNEHGIDMLR